MDLTEQIYVQCINCHSNIFADSVFEIDGPICEHCLFYESKLINQQKYELSILQSQLSTIKEFGVSQSMANKKEKKQTQESQRELMALEKQLEELNAEEKHLDNCQRQLQLKTHFLTDNYKLLLTQLSPQCQALGERITELNALCRSQAELLLEVQQLRKKKESLLGYSVLMELYHIHFDDEHAFINREPISIDNLEPLLDIIAYLIKKYNFPSVEINVSENTIRLKNGSIITMQRSDFKRVRGWIGVIVRETVNLWQHIKQECSLATKQNYDYYVLPFRVVLEPELSINGKSLTSQGSYGVFLKYFTHNIKYIISFDFDVELRSFSRWQGSKDQGLQSIE